MMDICKMICSENDRLDMALQLLESNGKKILFVVNQNQKLIGTVTDGDIRRSLLEGAGLASSVRDIVNRNFVYASDLDSEETIYEKFNESIEVIPIVNQNMTPIDYREFHNNSYYALAVPQINGNEYSYLMDAFLSTWISSKGKYVNTFEKNFSEYCNVQFGIATSNGTCALHLALIALEIKEGDEVIVPNLTFAATINAVLYTGATPVIVDIEREGWCIDPNQVRKAITPKTKAIIPVHIYGQPCDMDAICQIAREHNLYIYRRLCRSPWSRI